MKPYTVLRDISHDQKLYLPTRRIDLTDEQAEPLLKIGGIAEGYTGDEKGPAEEKPPVNTGPTDPAERLAKIKEAIPKLNVDSKDLWTAAGKPKAEAIETVTGWPVTAKERDEAWDALNPAQ